MKKHTYLFFILTLFSLIFCCACTSEEPRNPADALIGEDGTTAYIIVRSDTNDAATPEAVSLNSAIAERTGVELGLTTDFIAKAGSSAADKFKEIDTEILVGETNREASISLAAELPRSRDWGIIRTGTKIAIYGTECLEEAVQYFLDNYVADGNIYIADGEKYLHIADYTLDSLTLNGADMTSAEVYYESDTMIEAAKQLASQLQEMTGLAAKTERFKKNDTSAKIVFCSDDSLGVTETVCRMNGSTLEVASGLLADPMDGYTMLSDYIQSSIQSKTLAISDINLSDEGDVEHVKVADTAYFEALDTKAEAMKQAVLNTESEYTVGAGGKIYYFSEDGDDSNDGLSEETPLKSIDKLNLLILKKGDVVLFKRGDMFRGNITAKTGVTYSAYGEGAKPIINASKRNYADPSLWKQTEYENVWVCTEKLVNVGIVALDHSGELGKYDELVGTRMVAGRDDFNGAADMNEDLQVWGDWENDRLYFCSTEGNPGERFESIEIGERKNAISVSVTDVTIDNLHVTLTGAHGVGAGSTKNLTVRNCIFNWLGGSILLGHGGGNITGYGNAVEVYGSVDGYTVYNNWIYQIYDTGITHQFSSTPSKTVNNMNDVEYYDNLIEYCFWSLEYYNVRPEGTERKTTNVSIHDNFCRLGGYGWGCRTRETSAPMCAMNSSGEDVADNYLTNNIFDRCLGLLIRVGKEGTMNFSGNTYIQPYGVKFAYLWGTTYNFDSTARDTLAKVGETNPTLVYVMEEETAE
ncbi:MAG: right-handed parallel beta-helix repeat-containing protein [Clostridia bacterium]|nr:right-handed parallel beta-helix repeat-containing protein [Clostridia bacterium]